MMSALPAERYSSCFPLLAQRGATAIPFETSQLEDRGVRADAEREG
jgi:hypothetical protein